MTLYLDYFGLPDGRFKHYPQSHHLTSSVNSCIKNLGVLLDSGLEFYKQVNSVVSNLVSSIFISCPKLRLSFALKALNGQFMHFLSLCLDYCNSLYYGMNYTTLPQLQVVQNAAAILLKGFRKHEHITSLVASLF